MEGSIRREEMSCPGHFVCVYVLRRMYGLHAGVFKITHPKLYQNHGLEKGTRFKYASCQIWCTYIPYTGIPGSF